MSRARILTDILRMVIEILLAQKLPKRFFDDLRLVSKQFNIVVTPMLYRHFVLNNRTVLLLMSKESILPPYKVQIARNIREYTQHVTLKEHLPAEHLRNVFQSLKYLREVT